MFRHLISTLTVAVFALLSKLSATATGVSVTSVSLLKLSLQKRFGRAILLSDINRIGSIQSRSLELHDTISKIPEEILAPNDLSFLSKKIEWLLSNNASMPRQVF
jgi:hypothetical protein